MKSVINTRITVHRERDIEAKRARAYDALKTEIVNRARKRIPKITAAARDAPRDPADIRCRETNNVRC